jgi:antitoxin HicB
MHVLHGLRRAAARRALSELFWRACAKAATGSGKARSRPCHRASGFQAGRLFASCVIGSIAMSNLAYAVIVEPIAEAEGSGFLASVPDLPGCMTDAESPELALIAVRGTINEWIDEAKRLGRHIPSPARRVA